MLYVTRKQVMAYVHDSVDTPPETWITFCDRFLNERWKVSVSFGRYDSQGDTIEDFFDLWAVTFSGNRQTAMLTRRIAVYLGTHSHIDSKIAFPTGVLDRWHNCLLIYWHCLLPAFIFMSTRKKWQQVLSMYWWIFTRLKVCMAYGVLP